MLRRYSTVVALLALASTPWTHAEGKTPPAHRATGAGSPTVGFESGDNDSSVGNDIDPAVRKRSLARTLRSRQFDDEIARVESGLPPAVGIPGRQEPARSLAQAMKAAHVLGVSVAVIHDGKIAWSKGYGVVRGSGPAVTPATRFQAGSISKSFTALGAMRLAESGKLDLDVDIDRYLTLWRVPGRDAYLEAPVTMRRLLSHTAGLNVHGFPGYPSNARLPTIDQILGGASPSNTPAIRVESRPGEAWRYSGGGYVVAQKAIEDITGQSFAHWMDGNVLRPLGMRASSFEQDVPPGSATRADGHGIGGAPVAGGHHRYPEMGAAGMWTTSVDLAHALLSIQASLAGQRNSFLTPAMAAAMLDPVMPGRSAGFDVGGQPGSMWFSKGGDTEGFGAFVVAYRSGDGAVVMTNGGAGVGLATDIVRSIARVYGWPDFRQRMRDTVELPLASLSAYEGTYRYGGNGQFSLAVNTGRLVVTSPGERPEPLYAASPTELFPLSQDVSFVFDPSQPGQDGYIVLGQTRIPFKRDRP